MGYAGYAGAASGGTEGRPGGKLLGGNLHPFHACPEVPSGGAEELPVGLLHGFSRLPRGMNPPALVDTAGRSSVATRTLDPGPAGPTCEPGPTGGPHAPRLLRSLDPEPRPARPIREALLWRRRDPEDAAAIRRLGDLLYELVNESGQFGPDEGGIRDWPAFLAGVRDD